MSEITYIRTWGGKEEGGCLLKGSVLSQAYGTLNMQIILMLLVATHRLFTLSTLTI